MNKEQLKNLILNEPSKEEITKLIKIEEKAEELVKYELYNKEKNSVENNVIVIDLATQPNIIYAFQNGEEILKLEIKDNIAKNWQNKAKETYDKLDFSTIN